jgi:copper(I)-binding protein
VRIWGPALAALLASADWAGAKVIVTDAVIRPAPAGAPMTAAYMTLRNDGPRSVALTGARCGCAGEIAAHESSSEGGVMHMRPAPRVTIPPHGVLAFKPGGLHLMVMGLNRPIKPTERVKLTLSFDGAPPSTVVFKARR